MLLRLAGGAAVAAICAGVMVMLMAPGLVMGEGGAAVGSASTTQVALGRALYHAGCSSCHGEDARGVRGVAPSLRGVGAMAANFYLSTGRMPLSSPDQEPTRKTPAYTPRQTSALDAYIGSFGGPPVPRVPTRGTSLSVGQALFADNCSGCHQSAARGGIVPGAFAPALDQATPRQIMEAVRIGPYLMPKFGPGELNDQQVGSIARYIGYLHNPPDPGGWGIGHIGPVPEGMVVWFLAVPFVLLVARLIGERTED